MVCDSLIQHLNQKYNNLLDINYVLVTGGTGAVFFDQLKSFYVDSGVLEADHFLLANAELEGASHSIEFAVAVGAYKGLLGIA